MDRSNSRALLPRWTGTVARRPRQDVERYYGSYSRDTEPTPRSSQDTVRPEDSVSQVSVRSPGFARTIYSDTPAAPRPPPPARSSYRPTTRDDPGRRRRSPAPSPPSPQRTRTVYRSSSPNWPTTYTSQSSRRYEDREPAYDPPPRSSRNYSSSYHRSRSVSARDRSVSARDRSASRGRYDRDSYSSDLPPGYSVTRTREGPGGNTTRFRVERPPNSNPTYYVYTGRSTPPRSVSTWIVGSGRDRHKEYHINW